MAFSTLIIVSRRTLVKLCGLGVALVIVGSLAYQRVDNSLTSEDVVYISRFLEGGRVASLPSPRTFDDELRFITDVQKAVLDAAPEQRGIPDNTEREPRDLFLARAGLCYDRSRTIEKILRSAGLSARHVFMLANEESGFGLRAFITPAVPSHAVTEVLTARGWLVVDSNSPWVSLDSAGNPRSIKEVQAAESASSIRWKQPPPSDIYQRPLLAVYGLYSRHGRFFPPFNPVPDVNYGELLQNIW
jgi:hypothetical protein